MAVDFHVSAIGRRIIPAPVRRLLKSAYLQRKLDAALGRVARLSRGEAPSRALLDELQDAWDNHGMAARTDYLEEVALEAARTPGPVLECGSGLTTLLIGTLAGRRGVQSWSFEHLPEWRDRVSAVVERNGLRGTHLCHAPLREFDGFAWYDAPLDDMPGSFTLVVCDGPPGQTRGGRYGLVPMLGTRLAPGARILLDDVDRTGERDVLQRWEEEAGLFTRLRDTPTGAFAIVSRAAAV